MSAHTLRGWAGEGSWPHHVPPFAPRGEPRRPPPKGQGGTGKARVGISGFSRPDAHGGQQSILAQCLLLSWPGATRTLVVTESYFSFPIYLLLLGEARYLGSRPCSVGHSLALRANEPHGVSSSAKRRCLTCAPHQRIAEIKANMRIPLSEEVSVQQIQDISSLHLTVGICRLGF